MYRSEGRSDIKEAKALVSDILWGDEMSGYAILDCVYVLTTRATATLLAATKVAPSKRRSCAKVNPKKNTLDAIAPIKTAVFT